MQSRSAAGRVQLLAIFTTVLSILFAGCGSSSDSAILTNQGPNAVPETTTLQFAFTQVTPQFVVPSNGARLDFTFYPQANQQGAELFTATATLAPVVSIENVPVSAQSFLITVRDANGLPVAEIRGNLTPREIASGQVESSGLVTGVTLQSVTLTPTTATIAVDATQQFSLRGQYSNGETLTLAATFASSAPGVATVNAQSGLATGVGNGRAVITANFQQADYTAELLVDANAPALPLTVFLSDVANLFSFSSTTGPAGGSFSSVGITGGFAVDRLGTLYHSSTTVTALSRVAQRVGGTFDPTLDRDIGTSAFTWLALAERRGVLIGADSSASILSVSGTAGDLSSFFLLSDFPVGVAYDENNDRLFVSFQTGRIGVFDTFLSNALTATPGGNLDPNRVFSTPDLNNPKEIAYSPTGDTLFVADAGVFTGNDPGNTDGEIFLFSGASSASGIVAPQAVISGPDTELVDPKDIDLQGSELRVVDVDKLLEFSNVFLANGNISPDVTTPLTMTEGVATQVNLEIPPDSTDIVDPATVKGVLVTTVDADLKLRRISPDLSTQESEFDLNPIGDIPVSVGVDALGDVFMPTSGNSLYQLGRAANGSRDLAAINSFQDTLDRILPAAFIVFPAGIDVVDSQGIVLVADESQAIHGYAKNGNGSPLFVSFLGLSPTDLDYEPSTDDLYVSLLNGGLGTVGIFRDYLSGDTGTAMPDLILNVLGTINLTGIVYDATTDSLIVADSFGSVSVIRNVSTLPAGDVNPDIQISGAASLLFAPLDIAFDGQNLYVSDQASGLLRFDNILSSAGGEVAPSAQFALPNPGRLSLIGGFQ